MARPRVVVIGADFGGLSTARALRRAEADALTVGRNYAVVQIGRIRVAGFVGWLMWLFVHLTYTITFRSKTVILINWAWNYVLYDRPVRLITHAYPDGSVEAASAATARCVSPDR
jgi:NADH dehydrogenase FAD-containing subunit